MEHFIEICIFCAFLFGFFVAKTFLHVDPDAFPVKTAAIMVIIQVTNVTQKAT